MHYCFAGYIRDILNIPRDIFAGNFPVEALAVAS